MTTKHSAAEKAIIDYLIFDNEKQNPLQVDAGAVVEIFVKYLIPKYLEKPIYGLTLKSHDGMEVFGSNSLFENQEVQPKNAGNITIFQFTLPLHLISGDYFINIGLAAEINHEVIPIDRRYDLIHLNVLNSSRRYGIVDLYMQTKEIL